MWRFQEAESSVRGNYRFEGFNDNYTLAKQEKNEKQNLYKWLSNQTRRLMPCSIPYIPAV
jgi:hypothetical protein